MTIDEMLKRIKEKMACDYNISGCDTCNISSCEDKDIVIQLVEWLEELKTYREKKCNKSVYMASKSIDKIDATNKGYAYGYNKAIDDFLTDIINKINFEDKWLFDCKSNNANTDIAFSALRTFVNERAEQLKADGENDNKAI